MTSVEAAERTVGKKFPLSLLWLVGLIAALVGAAAYYASGSLNQDTSFLIVATDRWLRGAVLYRDIMETNPPLIFYVTAPAVLLSKVLHMDASAVFVILLCVLVLLSLIWCWSLLARVSEISEPNRYLIMVACFAALVITPSKYFGQREHLFIILALPYFFLHVLEPLGLKIRAGEIALIGLFGLAGFALKPYFLIPALLATSVNGWQNKSLRPFYNFDNLVLGLGCLIYVAFVSVHHPEYYATIVAIGSRVFYATGFGSYIVLDSSVVPILLVVAVASLGETSERMRNAFFVLSSVLAGLLGAYIFQGRGMDYQLLPLESMAVIASVFAAAVSSHTARTRPLHFVLFALVAILLVLRGGAFSRYESPYAVQIAGKLKAAAPDWHGKSIMVLSSEIAGAFPLINELGAEWTGRYPWQWIVAGVLTLTTDERCASAKKSCDELGELLKYARGTNVDDFVAREPDVVLIDGRAVKPYLPDKPFDYIEFLNGDPRFPEIWRHYKKVDSALGYDIWLRES